MHYIPFWPMEMHEINFWMCGSIKSRFKNWKQWALMMPKSNKLSRVLFFSMNFESLCSKWRKENTRLLTRILQTQLQLKTPVSLITLKNCSSVSHEQFKEGDSQCLCCFWWQNMCQEWWNFKWYCTLKHVFWAVN